MAILIPPIFQQMALPSRFPYSLPLPTHKPISHSTERAWLPVSLSLGWGLRAAQPSLFGGKARPKIHTAEPFQSPNTPPKNTYGGWPFFHFPHIPTISILTRLLVPLFFGERPAPKYIRCAFPIPRPKIHMAGALFPLPPNSHSTNPHGGS